jgi:acetyl/propionyl-CoA carboxylase alpha subunit/acetyl-CoA carboxylase carboxyltransferase component
MERIAIVNRGDAASRCIRAIRELRAVEGTRLQAIVLYTDPDRDAPFVRDADVALSLGPALRRGRGGAPRLAYLDHGRVLAALRATGADAVWPGWGFLSEDADFAAAVEERGLCFIGPPSAAMRRVGDKIAAKRLAESCGVPVAAWSGGAIDAAAAPAAARRIGLPLMVKAAAGGGGRGIRAVDRWEDLDGAIARAAAEASAAFGDGALFLEALLPRARHLEVQIAADAAGDCLALGLRDCSVQRRHQKIIEEAPPPDLAPAIDAALRDAAVRVARAAGYRGVGTVEFLLAADGDRFVFLEINPRLQVEHGLTELLTGFDLVQWQLRLARGEPLPGHAPAERGHAIEARVCAEDPAADFAPAPGRVVLYDPPGGPGVRVDTGVTLGSDMPPEFDALVAKVLAYAPTRAEALARLTCALDGFRLVLDGGATNKGLLLDLLADAALRRGAVDVGWLDRAAPRPADALAGTAALIAAAIQSHADARAAARDTFYAEAAIGAPRSVPPSTGMAVDLACGGERYRVQVLAIGDWRYRIGLDGRECVVRWLAEPPHAAQLELGDARHAVTLAPAAGALRIEIDGRPHRVARDDGGAVRAVAPAVVIAVDVAAGDHVRAGQRLALLETMKVEVPVLAPTGGVVRAVAVRPNARVAAGAVLLRIEAAVAAEPVAAATTRLALPDWRDPLTALADGAVDLAAFADADLLTRERCVEAVRGALRRLLLGYDRRADIDAPLDALLAAALPPQAPLERLGELAVPLREAVRLFADTEALFARQPLIAADGSLTPSHEAWLRLYLRQRTARGAGLPEGFAALLRRALGHYGCGDLTPGDALDRALLRLFAAQARRDDRQRVVAAALRWLTRLAAAGASFDDDRELAAALGACLTLRGQVTDGLADAAADARYVIIERPAMQRRAAAALAEALAPLTQPDAPAIDLETMQRLADSPPEVFARIAAWARDGGTAQRDVALQALVLRQYAPLAPRHRRATFDSGWNAVRFDCGAHGIVHAALAAPESAAAAAAALGEAAGGDTPALLELLVPVDEPLDDAALAALAAPMAAAAPTGARRLCVTALAADGSRRHHTLQRTGDTWEEPADLLGLHPETARRLVLDRLADFALERLDSGEGLYAFYARSRSVAADERIFVLAEVRAALPGAQGALHEPAFVHAFAEAVRALRAIRGERDRWRRLHWNRITLVVRPALYLLPETLDRLVEQLTPATRHLGLEKIVVRLLLRERPDGGAETARELVVEPTAGGAAEISWRAPHRAPLRPATAVEQHIAEARRRGLVHPAEAVRLFTAAPGARFEEFDLGAGGVAVSVDGRPPGGHTGGIAFGLITRPTDKHPGGMTRVLLLSDPTRELGALAAPECDRIVAALDLAAARGLPVEWVATSAGARIAMDSGTENLDATARVVRRIVRFTDAGGALHVIVAGVNVGAQSYFDALATMGPTTRGILIMLTGSAMVLTGRLALEASGGVAAEDETGIGGFDRIMGPSGQAQYYARDLAAAHALLLEHYRFTYCAPGEARPRPHPTSDPAERSIAAAPYPADDANGFASVGEIVSDATNPGRKRPFAMRPVLRALIDQDGGFLERWAGWAGAETAIVADAHLGGHAVCVIGIESQPVPRLGPRAVDGPAEWSAGTLFPLAAKKVARGLAAASGVRPAVIVATLAGFDGSPESMRTLQLEYGAAIARAVVNFDAPLLFAVVSRYHGGAYVVFSRALNDQLYAVALEGAYASVIGGGAAATAVFGREVRARADADPRLRSLRDALARSRDAQRSAALESELARLREQLTLEQHGEVAREFDAVHTVERARAVGSLNAIVSPAELRPHLIARLNATRTAAAGGS